jgi:hypothetical protein
MISAGLNLTEYANKVLNVVKAKEYLTFGGGFKVINFTDVTW